MKFRRRLRKIGGNSTGIILPPDVCKHLSLKPLDQVLISIDEKDRMIIEVSKSGEVDDESEEE